MSKKNINIKGTLIKNKRYYFTDDTDFVPLPNLVETQIISYDKFLKQNIGDVLEEFSPIVDYSGKKVEINFLKNEIEKPKFTSDECIRKNTSYEANLKVRVQIVNKESGEVKESDIYLGALPLMTDRASFIVNGIERVVISQIVRSDGATIICNTAEGLNCYIAKIIPKRGAWLEIEYDNKGVLGVKIDRRRKLPMTTFLRALGYERDTDIMKLFADLTKDMEKNPIETTLAKDTTNNAVEAYSAIYKRMRPGDMVTVKNAQNLFETMFFDIRRYDIGPVARYKMNEKLVMKKKNIKENRILMKDDFVALVRELILVIKGEKPVDDIDFLGNRRVKGVGELVEAKFRVGMSRLERIVKDRFSVIELESVTANQVINARPITAAIHEFFATSQLSQFMDQTNPLSEIVSKRRLSALGPGGLSRERAGFEVRDVHPSQYGRICPIATPEGPNIGLVTHLACYAKINQYGFIETPFRTVSHQVANKVVELLNRVARDDIKDDKKIIVKKDELITETAAKLIVKEVKAKTITVRGFLTDEYKYYDATQEEGNTIAQASSAIDKFGNFSEKRISSRKDRIPLFAYEAEINLIDISPKQIYSIETALIPFVEHDDATRAAMGTNMMKQAVPVVHPEAPIVGTGMEKAIADGLGYLVTATGDGIVTSVSGKQVSITYKTGAKAKYELYNFRTSNQSTVVHQTPRVKPLQKVKKGDILADGQSIYEGELAIGKNLLTAYMTWGGYNFEDAVIISDRVFREDIYSSVHIEEMVCDVRETKLGHEQVTRDIPNVNGAKLKDLDEDGIIRIGASVKESDILIGKITPKGETDLTPEERLLQAIFGEKAKDIKDTSLKVPSGKWGKVIGIQILKRKHGDDLPSGVITQIKVYIAQLRKISVGDKMAGRHGNKGVISKIVPMEDMPYLADGTPIDILLNPLGVSSRMNIGQVMETNVGWAAKKLGIKIATPVLNGMSDANIKTILKAAELPADGKVQLFDGRTGEPFDHKTTVGISYMLKLHHLVDDKIHARSVGPYSLVTQQPLGGKAQHGGQRFGEMEVWALEAYSASHTLQEMLTIKSDDVRGRANAYEAIIKGEEIRKPSIPESFNVLIHELQALCLKVEMKNKDHINTVLDLNTKIENNYDKNQKGEDKTIIDKKNLKIAMISEVTDIPETALKEKETLTEETLTEQKIDDGTIGTDGMDEKLNKVKKEFEE